MFLVGGSDIEHPQYFDRGAQILSTPNNLMDSDTEHPKYFDGGLRY